MEPPPQGRAEFQAVILAGGVGNRLYPLTDGFPKALLPIANRPMICFPLELLEKSGFTEVLVIVNSATGQQVSKYINELYKGKLRVSIAVLDGFIGTADALRKVRDRITTDFIVISCDLITDVFIHYLADIHRAKDASLTVLLHDPPAPKEEEKKDKKEKDLDDISLQYIGLEGRDATKRLILFKSAADVEDELSVRKSRLRKHPNVTIHTRLRDAHLYIFSHWVLDLLEERKEISSIQNELVPLLVRLQFDATAANWRERARAASIQSMALDMSHAPKEDGEIQCYAFVAPSASYVARANTVPSYMAMNREIATDVVSEKWTPIEETNELATAVSANATAGFDRATIVGKDLRIGAQSSVKRSIIGSHCKIGAAVKIMSCIIMDHVTIEDRCQLQNVILCKDSSVGSGCIMVNSQVGTSFSVPANTNSKGEALCNTRDTM